MHNLTYMITGSRTNSSPNFAQPQKQKTTDKKPKIQRTEKNLSTLTINKIVMQEVFEKHNHITKTKPFVILNNSNLAFSASKILLKKVAIKHETLYNKKITANLVTTAIMNEISNMSDNIKKHHDLVAYFTANEIKAKQIQMNATKNVELFGLTVTFLSDLKAKESIQELVNMNLFKSSFQKLDVAKLNDDKFAHHVLNILKILLKVLSKDVLLEFRNSEFIKKLMEKTFEDKKMNAFRIELAKVFYHELAQSNGGNHEKAQLNGSRKNLPTASSAVTVSTSGLRPETHTSMRQKSNAHFNVIFDNEIPKIQKNAEKEVSQLVFKDQNFRALIKPYFEMSPDVNFYKTFVDQTFGRNESVPKSFEQMLTYFPNYSIINEILHKNFPKVHDIEKTMYVVNTLFTPQELNRSVTFEDYIDRIVHMILNQEKVYIPYLLNENNYIRCIVSEICQNKFVEFESAVVESEFYKSKSAQF